MKYQYLILRRLTAHPLAGSGTVLEGQFDWGGLLPKSNGGSRRSPQAGWQSAVECMDRRWLNCETNKSSRYESRPK